MPRHRGSRSPGRGVSPLRTRRSERATLSLSPTPKTSMPSPDRQTRSAAAALNGGRQPRASSTTPTSKRRSPQQTKTATTPEEAVRRSGRQRKLNYHSFDADYMMAENVSRFSSPAKPAAEGAAKQQSEEDASESEVSEATPRPPPRRRPQGRAESPFYNHVQFSPSAKPGSPSIRSRLRHSNNRSVRNVRLHNLTSEDEQTEFNRRYSRDLRSRRRRNRGEEEEESHAIRRSTRRNLAQINHQEVSDEESKEEEEEEEEDEDEEEEGGDVEMAKESAKEAPMGLRRSTRSSQSNIPARSPSTSEEEEDDEDEEEEEEEEEDTGDRKKDKKVDTLLSSRPRRSRVPVERLNYGYLPPEEHHSRSSRRRGNGEIRNLDQYSSDEEFNVADTKSRKKKYNMRNNPRTISRYQDSLFRTRSSGRTRENERERSKETRRKKVVHSYKDRSSSSSSASSSSDEEHFQRRKTKRMNIERSKLLPVNLQKQDVAKSIFRDRQKVGSSLADVSPMELDLNVKFSNVGGCQKHIDSLKEMVVFPLLYPEVFSKFHITPPRGVLFYGPPGTGKTLLARALASECSTDGRKVAFFMRKGADCLSKWIGESERQLRLLFDQAYVMRPSIIFFDEIDGLAPVRSSRQDQIHSSIVSTLLALMDGLDNRGEIIVIGATNRIENIDPALRRPGRFDRELRFALPTRDARKEIIQLHTKSWVPPLEGNTVDLLADKTIGYCGADIKGLCAEAALNALRRRYPQVYTTTQKLAINVEEVLIKDKDFDKAMLTMVPSTHRMQDQNQAPLPPGIRCLLQTPLNKICQEIDRIMPLPPNENRRNFRPRILIHGHEGQGLTTYLGPAVLHHLEKIPCHRLDIPALFSNAARSPEEALCQIIHECKQTAPSCLYLPHVNRMWRVMSASAQETLVSLLSDILPSMSLLIIAVMEEPYSEGDANQLPANFISRNEAFAVENPSAQERKEFFAPVFHSATEPISTEKSNEEEAATEELEVLPVVDNRKLTEKEAKRLRKKEEHLQRELRIFLREIWTKINREQKFFMFRSPVDTDEVYDYLEVVENPMDFDKMLTKLDNREYTCAKDFLADIDLIADNAISYNSDLNYETNKIICHRARALQDFSYALIKAEMDTDFEDNCKEISAKRADADKKLEETPATPSVGGGASSVTPSSSVRRKKKRISSWARGESRTRKKQRRSNQQSDEEDDEDEEDEEDETATANNGTSLPEQMMVPTGGVRIDQSRLNHLQSDLVLATENLSLESLEKVFASLMEIVGDYAQKSDRTQLPADIQRKIESIKTTSRYSLRH